MEGTQCKKLFKQWLVGMLYGPGAIDPERAKKCQETAEEILSFAEKHDLLHPAILFTPSDIGAMFFEKHSHAELCSPEEIVYKEADVIDILQQLGFPKPKF